MQQPPIKSGNKRETGFTEIQCIQLLQSRGIHITIPRKAVLLAFLQSEQPLTQAQVKQYCLKSVDRVTIYRTLGLLVKNGVLHVLPATDGTLRYAFTIMNTKDTNNYQHVHFICKACHQTFCLPDVYPPRIPSPQDFEVLETEVILKGYCKNCTDALGSINP